MKILTLFLILSGCGYSQRNVEMDAQIKRIINVTPILCPDRTEIDVSMGIFRNGVGSASTHDMWVQLIQRDDLKMLQQAMEVGTPVKIFYNTKRFTFCDDEDQIDHVELLK